MSTQDEQPAPPKALTSTGGWLDDRFRGAQDLPPLVPEGLP